MAAIRTARESRTVFLSVLGNSWFWFYGALVLAQLPLFVKSVLNGSEEVVTLLLFVFSAGVGIGSLLCEKLSSGKVEIGLDAVRLDRPHRIRAGSRLRITAVAGRSDLRCAGIPESARCLGAFSATSCSSVCSAAFFIVPLYALIQQRSRPEAVSRVISATNIINALFMVAAALFGRSLYAMD